MPPQVVNRDQARLVINTGVEQAAPRDPERQRARAFAAGCWLGEGLPGRTRVTIIEQAVIFEAIRGVRSWPAATPAIKQAIISEEASRGSGFGPSGSQALRRGGWSGPS